MYLNNNYKNKNVLVFGLGVTGKSVVRYMKKKGANIFIYDDDLNSVKDFAEKNDINLFESKREQIEILDLAILSPSVPTKFPKPHRIIQEIKKIKEIPFISDIEVFTTQQNNSNLIAITGTNGKSTIAALVHHVLKSVGKDSILCGNIGEPVLNFSQLQNRDFVIEISSYQLDKTFKARFNISAFSNLSLDHQDLHDGIEEYRLAKKRIFDNQHTNDFSIINIDYPETLKTFKEIQLNNKSKVIALSTNESLDKGIFIKENFLFDNFFGKKKYHLNLPFSLTGDHNLENFLVAYAILKANKISSKDIFYHTNNFKSLPHRMELVKEIKNVRFINDSKATNPDSTKHALMAFDNIIWLVGNKKKGDINSLRSKLSKVKKIYCFGEVANEYNSFFNSIGKKSGAFENLSDVFTNLKGNLRQGENVLLSPACSSYDQYKNFEERGNHFKNLVETITLKDIQ